MMISEEMPTFLIAKKLKKYVQKNISRKESMCEDQVCQRERERERERERRKRKEKVLWPE